jgi:transcriptional regulator with XRE-family HTH domain
MPDFTGMTKQEATAAKRKFGKHVKKIRNDKGLSLLQVSYNCDLYDGRISAIEHGELNITLTTILELAKGLEVHPSKLFD